MPSSRAIKKAIIAHATVTTTGLVPLPDQYITSKRTICSVWQPRITGAQINTSKYIDRFNTARFSVNKDKFQRLRIITHNTEFYCYCERLGNAVAIVSMNLRNLFS